jgi:putative DNA primase/helicase
MRHAKATARALWLEVAHSSDETRRKALAKWAAYSESEPGLRRMLALARCELAITPDHLDADPWLVNCPNGTLELRTAHLRPHRREDFITKMTAAPYDPDAHHETWEHFLETALPDDGARAYAQRFAGYALTADCREDVFVFLRGPAGAGKTTMCQALQTTWGDYAVAADFSVFLAKKHADGPRETVARLAGARLVTSVETRDGARLDEGLLKQLVGGDRVVADRKYEHVFEFQPACKLLLASNFRPRAHADDDGLWRRLREVPFPIARPRREDRDDSIRATLIDPAQAGAAILAWAVEGCTQWLADGLHEPPGVREATDAYRRSQEPLTDFVEECCTLGPARTVPAQSLRDAYESWAKAQGIKHPLSGKAWGQALRALGCTDRRTTTTRLWVGIDVRPPDSDATLGEPSEHDRPW